jgi:hypothetical protein
MKHIRSYNESAAEPLFRELTLEEIEKKTGDLRIHRRANKNMSVAASRWLDSINKEDSMFKFYGELRSLVKFNRKNVLGPETPRYVERMVDLITKSHGEFAVDSVLIRPYDMSVDVDNSHDVFIILNVRDHYKYSEVFTLQDLPDIEVGAVVMENSQGDDLLFYFLHDNYILVKVAIIEKGSLFLWCDGVAGVLEGLATVLPTTT